MGFSQNALARQLDVTATTVSLWETGRSSPSATQRLRLCALEGAVPGQPLQSLFRPIQYLGSKLKISGRICELVDAVSMPGDVVGDIFSGSAVVSGALGQVRRTVAVDVQSYAATLAEAVLAGDAGVAAELRGSAFLNAFIEAEAQRLEFYRELVELDDRATAAAAGGDGRLLDQLISFGSLAAFRQAPHAAIPPDIRRALSATAARVGLEGQSAPGAAAYYGGVYFSMRQAVALDAISVALDGLSAEANRLGRAVLLSVASDVVNTVGKQFAQPMRIVKANCGTQPLLLARAVRDRSIVVSLAWMNWLERWATALSVPRIGGRAIKGDVLEFIDRDTECAAFYADPPYTIDHYSRFYHVLETLTLRDAPRLDTQRQGGADRIMRGLYRSGRYQSPFSVPSAVGPAFQRLFKGVARGGRSLVLSYSPFDPERSHRPRLLSLEEILGLARSEFRRVEAVGVTDHSHRKLNSREANVESPGGGEVLIVCEA